MTFLKYGLSFIILALIIVSILTISGVFCNKTSHFCNNLTSKSPPIRYKYGLVMNSSLFVVCEKLVLQNVLADECKQITVELAKDTCNKNTGIGDHAHCSWNNDKNSCDPVFAAPPVPLDDFEYQNPTSGKTVYTCDNPKKGVGYCANMTKLDPNQNTIDASPNNPGVEKDIASLRGCSQNNFSKACLTFPYCTVNNGICQKKVINDCGDSPKNLCIFNIVGLDGELGETFDNLSTSAWQIQFKKKYGISIYGVTAYDCCCNCDFIYRQCSSDADCQKYNKNVPPSSNLCTNKVCALTEQCPQTVGCCRWPACSK